MSNLASPGIIQLMMVGGNNNKEWSTYLAMVSSVNGLSYLSPNISVPFMFGNESNPVWSFYLAMLGSSLGKKKLYPGHQSPFMLDSETNNPKWIHYLTSLGIA